MDTIKKYLGIILLLLCIFSAPLLFAAEKDEDPIVIMTLQIFNKHDDYDEKDIHIMYHAGRLRISIHGYNTLADIEHLLQTLEEALGQI